MLGTTLEVLDTSIVNVALPHMQGSFSASVDEIAWVLTSYLVANGIMIPMTGWISSRFGRKRYFHDLGVGLRRRFGAVRRGRIARSDGGLPPDPGCGRRRDDAVVASHPDGDLSAGRAAARDGDVGRGPDGRADHGTDAGRLDHRQLELALEFLHQRADRHRSPSRWSRRSSTIPPYLREHRARGGKVDYVGIACLVVGLGAMQIVLDRGQRADWFASPWVVCDRLLSATALIILVINELRFADPILDLRILKIQRFQRRAGADRRDEFVLYGTGLLNADLPAGVHGLHGVEGRAGAGTARARDDAVDDDGRADCARAVSTPARWSESASP